MIIQIALAVFVLLELSNVIALYFKPEMPQANAMGAFKLWESSKTDQNMHNFIRYMAYWVAGSKLIFISLLGLIIFLGDELLQFYTIIVLVLSISTYYWKLRPIMNELDANNLITPKGYSRQLTNIITVFILVLGTAGIVDFLFV